MLLIVIVFINLLLNWIFAGEYDGVSSCFVLSLLEVGAPVLGLESHGPVVDSLAPVGGHVVPVGGHLTPVSPTWSGRTADSCQWSKNHRLLGRRPDTRHPGLSGLSGLSGL